MIESDNTDMRDTLYPHIIYNNFNSDCWWSKRKPNGKPM